MFQRGILLKWGDQLRKKAIFFSNFEGKIKVYTQFLG